MCHLTRSGRERAYGAIIAAVALTVAMLSGGGVFAPPLASSGSGATPQLYLSDGTGGVDQFNFNGVSGSSGSKINAGEADAIAINSTATYAVVAVANTSEVAFTAHVNIVDLATGQAAGEVPSLAPVGFAMDPTNPDLAYFVTAAGEIGSFPLGPGSQTVTAFPSLGNTPQGTTFTSIAVSPNGQTVYVAAFNVYADSVYALSTGGELTGEWAKENLYQTYQIRDLVISPSGGSLFLVAEAREEDGYPNASTVDSLSLPLTNDDGVDLAASWTETSNALLRALTVSPNGQTLYAVGEDGTNSVLVVYPAASGDTPTTVTVPFETSGGSDGLSSVAESPDGSSVFLSGYSDVTGGDEIYPVTAANLTLGAPSSNLGGSGGGPQSLAVTPDQAPVASLNPVSAIAGQSVTLNAAASTIAYGSISSYAWNFGDGQTATTSGPTVGHAYASPGSYTTTVTETDSAGNSTIAPYVSTAVNSDGQTPYFDSSASASTTAKVTVKAPATSLTTTPTHLGATSTTSGPTPDVQAGKPTLTLNPGLGPPGTIVVVTGKGFPKNTPITVSWSTSTGSVVIASDQNGDLPASRLVILTPDVLGPRFAVASITPAVRAPFLVVPSTSEPGGDDGSILFRSEGP